MTAVSCLAGAKALCQEGEVAFVGATIETMGDAGPIENGSLLIKDGKVQAVGTDIKIPETARLIDGRGTTILPGLIDPYYPVRIAGAAPRPTTRTIVISGRTITVPSSGSRSTPSFARVADSFYPFSIDFRPLARTGVTLLNLTASGYGQAALARNTPEQRESMLIQGDGVMFASVTNDSRSLDVLRKGLAGRSSSNTKSTTEAKAPTTGQPSGRPPSQPPPASRQLWTEVREGKRRLIVNANNAASILHLLHALKPYEKVKLTLVSTGSNVYQTLDELKGRKVSLILQPAIEMVPNSRVRMCVPRIAHQAGISFALSLSLSKSEMTESQDVPLLRIAYLVKAGLPRDVALAALTRKPAELLGLEKTHGSIGPQKVANLLIFEGDPLDPSSQLKRVLVEGNTVYED